MLSGHTSDVLALSSPAEDLILFASRDSTANVHAGSSSTCVVVHGPIHWCFSVPKPCFDTTKLGSSLELHGSLRRRVAVFERWCPSGDGGPPVYSPGSLPSFHRCAWRRHTMSAVGDTTPTPATPAPPTATATPRTLVLVFDGTADEYNAYNTNAVRLFGWALRFSSFCEHVMDGYRFLMDDYYEGDRICLFGFSRGAYTARALAGMLHKVGPALLPRLRRRRARRGQWRLSWRRRQSTIA
uniref:T6SS Phospholipase effector Tle1-like catalytic domain-containing protein n=1 Tax=Mycena chlorophos TaxID=658473 RepID=A0ABQ0LEW9_MYCCL|nr:predicted protein [Mycena chlorophos]